MKLNKTTATIAFVAMFGVVGTVNHFFPNNPLSEVFANAKAHLEQQMEPAPAVIPANITE